MNKKAVGSSLLVSSFLVGLGNNVAGASWKDVLDNFLEVVNKEFDAGQKVATPVSSCEFEKSLDGFGLGLEASKKIKDGVRNICSKMTKYKQLLLDLWCIERKGDKSSESVSKEQALNKKIGEHEKMLKESVEDLKKLCKSMGLINKHLFFPWDVAEKKFASLFGKKYNPDLDETDKGSILSSLTFFTENEEESIYAEDYLDLSRKLAAQRLQFLKKPYNFNKEGLVSTYVKRQNLVRRILEDQMKSVDLCDYVNYGFIPYRAAVFPEDKMNSLQYLLASCGELLKKVRKKAGEIIEKDRLFSGKKPEYRYTAKGVCIVYHDDDWAEDKDSWFGGERIVELERLINLRESLNQKKRSADVLARECGIFLPWHEINYKKYGFLFNLSKNKELDTVITEEEVKRGCYVDSLGDDDVICCRLKPEKRLLEAMIRYSNRIAKARRELRSEKELSLSDKVNLVLLWQAKSWVEEKISKGEHDKSFPMQVNFAFSHYESGQ